MAEKGLGIGYLPKLLDADWFCPYHAEAKLPPTNPEKPNATDFAYRHGIYLSGWGL